MKKLLLQFAMLIFAAIPAMAQAPQAFNYQGVARSAAGAPLVSQPIGLQITIHDGSSSGTTVYQETFTVTTNAFGLYNASIGRGTVASGTFNTINWASGPKYLEVAIDPVGGTSYTSVGSNELLSVPYALYAAASPASGVTGSGTTNYVPKFTGATAIGNSHIIDNGTSVGIDTTTPWSICRLQVAGVGTYDGASAPIYQAGIIADGGASAASASGIYGEGGWRGVYGRNPGIATGSEAIGVLGRVEGSSYVGTGYGVKGECAGTGGTANYGVYGTATSTGNGVAGVLTGGGTGAAGVFDGGTSGYGVIVKNGTSGFNTTTPTSMAKVEISGVGTYGSLPYYQAGLAVDGSSTASASGVYGEGGWRGVYGRNPGTAAGVEAMGVYGRCEGSAYTSNGYGVKGEAVGGGPTNYGVYGNATGATTNNYGIYGTNSGTGYAGYFSGNVHITGSIAKGSGTFMIDHPLDPENKYLYHSFVESPDMMNIYNGNIVTDANGDATVTMPDYFEALNKDFRYQLTVIGTFAQAIVAEKVSGNHFKIKTDKPNVEVSWQVTGVRQDKYANAHRVVPEVEKEPQYKGYYLHAAEWGMPESKSIDALTKPQPAGDNTGLKNIIPATGTK